ncbi:hypothetical protein XELAEV_18010649mg [Xenopus laevis]|uniref:Uncharacterized protein n=1 Tax=Xenopus laevis TaxID=8355 RepID=A0A974I1H9_XENLA|nr:hypothetical protein XELAEV_18010649mg [Xenopus laevis]
MVHAACRRNDIFIHWVATSSELLKQNIHISDRQNCHRQHMNVRERALDFSIQSSEWGSLYSLLMLLHCQ